MHRFALFLALVFVVVPLQPITGGEKTAGEYHKEKRDKPPKNKRGFTVAPNYWDNSDADNDGNVAANWSLGTVPAGTDVATLNNTSDTDCTFSGNITTLGLNADAVYDGNIDFGDSLTHAWGASGMVFDHNGNVDLGTGTAHAVTAGMYDVTNVGGTITVGTSTVTLNGVCTWRGKASINSNYNLTIAAGAVVTSSGGGDYAKMSGTLDVYGSFTATPVQREPLVSATGIVKIQTGSSYSGFLRLDDTASGKGITVMDGTLAATVFLLNPLSGSVWAEGDWGSGLVHVKNTANYVQRVFALSGAYTFGEIKLGRSGFGNTSPGHDLVWDLSANPTVTVTGDITIDIDSTGGVTLDASSVALTLQGDLIDEITGGGSFTASAQALTLSGTNSQDIDGCGGTWGAVIENKTAGTVTLSGLLTCASFTGTDGDLDINSQTITSAGAVDFASGFTLADATGATLGCDTVSFDGQSVTGLTINATTSGTATGTTFANVTFNGPGGAKLDASDGTNINGGGNSGIDFGAVATPSTFRGAFSPTFAGAFG